MTKENKKAIWMLVISFLLMGMALTLFILSFKIGMGAAIDGLTSQWIGNSQPSIIPWYYTYLDTLSLVLVIIGLIFFIKSWKNAIKFQKTIMKIFVAVILIYILYLIFIIMVA